MSAPSRSIVFTSDARADFTSNMLYTFETWGENQRDQYARRLTTAIRRLILFPNLGERRNDISTGLRASSVDMHVVFYRVLPQQVVIVRILHAKMDAVTELGDERH